MSRGTAGSWLVRQCCAGLAPPAGLRWFRAGRSRSFLERVCHADRLVLGSSGSSRHWSHSALVSADSARAAPLASLRAGSARAAPLASLRAGSARAALLASLRSSGRATGLRWFSSGLATGLCWFSSGRATGLALQLGSGHWSPLVQLGPGHWSRSAARVRPLVSAGSARAGWSSLCALVALLSLLVARPQVSRARLCRRLPQ